MRRLRLDTLQRRDEMAPADPGDSRGLDLRAISRPPALIDPLQSVVHPAEVSSITGWSHAEPSRTVLPVKLYSALPT
jgi:hypothetical protein